MLEWFTSRFTVVFATILLLSSVFSYFGYERDYSVTGELKTVADGIASFIDMSFRIEGDSILRVTFTSDGDLILPAEIGGKPYQIELRNDAVVLGQHGRKATGHWTGLLHLWKPVGNSYSSNDIESEDSAHVSLNFNSGQPFRIEPRCISIEGVEGLHVFAYKTTR